MQCIEEVPRAVRVPNNTITANNNSPALLHYRKHPLESKHSKDTRPPVTIDRIRKPE